MLMETHKRTKLLDATYGGEMETEDVSDNEEIQEMLIEDEDGAVYFNSDQSL